MNAINSTSAFSRACMLVSVSVSSWTGRALDKKITEEIAQQHNAKGDMGRYNKILVDKKYLEPVQRAAGKIGDYFRTHTLPWWQNGTCILPVGMLATFKADMERLKDEYEQAWAHFCSIEAEWKADAKVRLNGAYNESDYPSDVRGKFGVRVRYLPVPDAKDFRAEIADSERQALTQQIEATLSDASRQALGEIYQRLAEPVQAMAERLAAYRVTMQDGKQKTEGAFRDSLVGNLRDIVDLLPKLNFAGDTRLTALGERISATLLAHSAQDLRDDFQAREKTQREAADVAREIGDIMGEFMAE